MAKMGQFLVAIDSEVAITAANVSDKGAKGLDRIDG
jgi:hypothetical protein